MTPWFLTLALGFLAQNLFAERHEFPLEPGRYWDYQGNVVWADPGASAVQRRTVTWRMEIVEVITRDWTTAAVLKGHPRDLMFFDPKREPRTSLLVSVNLQKYYLLEDDRAQEALSRLKDPQDLLMGLLRESELFLEAPVSIGKRFCDTEMLTRTDTLYCWWVDEEREPSIKTIPGMEPGWDGPEYTMSFRSPSSSEFIGFAPGIGITSYDFSHHGSPSNVQLKLTAFGRTAPR
jgi:hypothetical protein